MPASFLLGRSRPGRRRRRPGRRRGHRLLGRLAGARQGGLGPALGRRLRGGAGRNRDRAVRLAGPGPASLKARRAMLWPSPRPVP